MPAIALAGGRAGVASSAHNSYAAEIAEAARRFRLAPSWIGAVLKVESAGDPAATSNAGAMGLMQIEPGTWSDLHIRYRLGSDPYDPRDNILAGAAYIRELLDRYGSPGWIAAYNAGPGRYEASLQGQPLPEETRAYVVAVTSAIGYPGTANNPTSGVTSPSGWNQAPLFVALPNSGSAADDLHAEQSAPGTPMPQSARQSGAVDPQSAGLFVGSGRARSGP